MSMYERNPGSPVVVSDKIAEQIKAKLELEGMTVEEVLDMFPILKSIDKAMTAIQDVYNDCLLAQQEIADLEGDNLASTKTALEDVFKEVTGNDPEEYGVSWDPEAGSEAEDDEREETGDEDGAVAHGEE